MKSRRKKQHKNNNNLQTSRTNKLLCRGFFRLSREECVKYMRFLKKLHQSVPLWADVISLVIQPLATGIYGVIGCFVAIIGTAAVSIISAKSRNAHCISG